MRSDEDFLVYVGARWPALVRGLVERGATPEQAHELAAEALSRCRRRWAAESRDGDVDALVREELAAVWPGSATGAAAEDLTVLAPPTLADLDDRTRGRRRRTARRAVLLGVPLLLVAAGATWWTTRADEPEQDRPEQLEQAQVTEQTNPAGVVWYADGTLHLQQVVLTVPGVRSLAAVADGVVYADAEDRVVHVDASGARTRLGETAGEVVADAAGGLVAWLAPGEELTAWSARTGEEVGAREVDGVTRVVAVAGQTVFFADPAGTRAWQPGTGQAPGRIVEPAYLLAAAASTRAYQVADGRIRVERSFDGISFEVAGEGASISGDGSLVLSHRGGRVVLYDSRTGERVDSGLDDRYEVAAAALLGPGDRVTYVVARARPETAPGFVRTVPSGHLELRTCSLVTHACTALARFPADDAPPLLAA